MRMSIQSTCTFVAFLTYLCMTRSSNLTDQTSPVQPTSMPLRPESTMLTTEVNTTEVNTTVANTTTSAVFTTEPKSASVDIFILHNQTSPTQSTPKPLRPDTTMLNTVVNTTEVNTTAANTTEVNTTEVNTTAANTTEVNTTAANTTTMVVSITKPKAVAVDVRLPTSFYPLHYNMEIQTFLNGTHPDNFTFKGYVKIWLKCDSPTDNVTLHGLNLNLVNESIKFYCEQPDAVLDPKITGYDVDNKRQFLIFKLDNTTQVNKTYIIEMSYSSRITNTVAGLFYGSYKTDQNTTVYMATTHFQPTYARRVFPCFDEPAMKSTFNLTLVRPVDMISLSNMKVIDSSQNFTDGDIVYVKDVFGQSPKMSTYLLVMAVCDFDYLSKKTKSGIEFRTYAVPALVNTTQYSLDIGVEMLTYFEEFFNISYPLPKLDMIALPNFLPGAMENWGMISSREGETSLSDKQGIAFVISHELSHMWFGNLVTMSWWDDIWLNEGFASYMLNLGVDYVHPDWKMFDTFVVNNVYSTLSKDGLVSSHPIYVPVNHPDEINVIFDLISYYKGGALIRMMSHFLGMDTFKKGLNRYLITLKYSNAFHNDLWNALSQQAAIDNKSIDVKAVMDTWILQMNYPLVTVRRVPDRRDILNITQERYLQDRTAANLGKYESPFNYTWTIPLSFTSNDTRDFSQTDQNIYWMYRNETTKLVDLRETLPENTNSWILANIEEYGYYRVNYDLENWKALTDQLEDDHTVIPVINRAQIINDAWSLAKSGYLSFDIAFSTLNYLDKEMDYHPWLAVKQELNYLDNMFSVHSIYGLFQRFLRCKLKNPYLHFRLNNTGASDLQILASVVMDSRAASDQYQQWMQSNSSENLIDTNLRYVVYCKAIAAGGYDEWQHAFNRYLTEQLATERTTLLSAMACSRQPWILNHYMGLTLIKDSGIRTQESLKVIYNVVSNPVGRSLAWNFYRSNFNTLKKLYSSLYYEWLYLVEAITQPLNTAYELEELKAFKIAQGNTSYFDKVIEKVTINVKWMEANQANIARILKSKLAQSKC